MWVVRQEHCEACGEWHKVTRSAALHGNSQRGAMKAADREIRRQMARCRKLRGRRSRRAKVATYGALRRMGLWTPAHPYESRPRPRRRRGRGEIVFLPWPGFFHAATEAAVWRPYHLAWKYDDNGNRPRFFSGDRGVRFLGERPPRPSPPARLTTSEPSIHLAHASGEGAAPPKTPYASEAARYPSMAALLHDADRLLAGPPPPPEDHAP